MSQSAQRLQWMGFTASQASPVHRRATPALSLQVPAWIERATVRVNCLTQERNTTQWLKPRPLDPAATNLQLLYQTKNAQTLVSK